MSILTEIADQYAIADAVFGDAEQQAFHADDEAAFDKAVQQRRRNDQAYFLYIFTRYEAEVNAATRELLSSRTASPASWSERRVWQAWSRGSVPDIPFLSKVEVLTDKGLKDYAAAKQYYDGRNKIAHGQYWAVQFSLPDVAQDMDRLVGRWMRT